LLEPSDTVSPVPPVAFSTEGADEGAEDDEDSATLGVEDEALVAGLDDAVGVPLAPPVAAGPAPVAFVPL